MAALGVFVFWFCDARLNMVCIFLWVAICVYYKIQTNRAGANKAEYRLNGTIQTVLALSTTLCAAGMIGLSAFYSSQNKFLMLLDNILSGRLRLGKKGIDVFGFSLWGKSIPMQGLGGTAEEMLHYFFLDSSYLSIVLQYGLLVLGAVLVIWTCIGFRAKKENDLLLLLIVAIISVQCMVEHHMLDIAYNPFLWVLFADTAQNRDVLNRGTTIRKREVMYEKK